MKIANLEAKKTEQLKAVDAATSLGIEMYVDKYASPIKTVAAQIARVREWEREDAG